MEGAGVLKYANGDVYEGEYKDNKMHGRGVRNEAGCGGGKKGRDWVGTYNRVMGTRS